MDNTFTFTIPGYTITIVGTALVAEVVKDVVIENTDNTSETLAPEVAPVLEAPITG